MNPTAISETARRVAAQRLAFERVAAPYGDPSADERLSRDISAGMPQDGPLRRYLEARTRFFDTVVVRCLDGGITQVVVGAAGYDCRSLRYAKPGVRWFEIDRSPTQRDKRTRLERLRISCAHVSFVAADFETDDLCALLAAQGLDESVPSLFLLEGVAAYLERGTVHSVLAQFARSGAPGSRLAVSLTVSQGSAARAARREALRQAVEVLGEPMRSSVAPDEVDGLLGSTGWAPAGSANDAGFVLAERRP